MSALADKYHLEDGKSFDFYKAHDKWCVTKAGAENIAAAEGITFKVDHFDQGAVFVAYRGTFYCEGLKTPEFAGRSLQEIGSCRFNSGTKTFFRTTDANGKEQVSAPLVSNPESTHAPEMAWKRLYVRGILGIVGASKWASGADEMPSDWHRHGNGNGNGGGYAQTATATPPVTNADGTPNHATDARYRAASESNGWFPEAVKIPTEWNNLMGAFCDCTHQPRAMWERLIFDHVGKFQGAKGWWTPSAKYKSFNDAVFGVDTWQGNRKSKAPWALVKLHEARDVYSVLESTGMAILEVPDKFGIMKEYRMLKHGHQDGGGYPSGAAADKAPKPENEIQRAPDFPEPNDFGGGDSFTNDDVPF